MHMIGHDDIAADCPAKPNGRLAPFFEQNVDSLRMGQNTPSPLGACGQKHQREASMPDTIKSPETFVPLAFATRVCTPGSLTPALADCPGCPRSCDDDAGAHVSGG